MLFSFGNFGLAFLFVLTFFFQREQEHIKMSVGGGVGRKWEDLEEEKEYKNILCEKFKNRIN